MDRNPKVKDLMSRPVRRLTPDATVRDAASFMLRWNITGAPVVDQHGNAIGMYSHTDLARHIQEKSLEVPVADVREERVRGTGEHVALNHGLHIASFEVAVVSEFMTPGVVSVDPEAPLSDAVRTMTEFAIHRVLVVGKDGEIEGILTSQDVLKWLQRSWSWRAPDQVKR